MARSAPHSPPRFEAIFANAADILGVDLTSDTLPRDISRARRRLLADIETSPDGTYEVDGWRVDRQAALRLADALLEPNNVELLRALGEDEPLRQFLTSSDPTWAGRIRNRSFYKSDAFQEQLVPALRASVRRALATCWRNDDHQGFARVLRVLDHVADDALRNEVETFLNSQLHRLSSIRAEVEEGEEDPDEDILPERIAEAVSAPCLNVLSTAFSSYRSTFYRAARAISLICNNDFGSNVAAVRTLGVVAELELDESECKQRRDDLAVLERLSAVEQQRRQYHREIAQVSHLCETIEALPTKRLADNPEVLQPDLTLLTSLPSPLKERLADQLAGEMLSVAVGVWNEHGNFQASCRICDIAGELPLSSDGKTQVLRSKEQLEKVWQDGLRDALRELIKIFSTVVSEAGRVSSMPNAQVNTGALDDVLRKAKALIGAEELAHALALSRRSAASHSMASGKAASAQAPVRSESDLFFELVEMLTEYGSENTCVLALKWIEPVADNCPRAHAAVETIRRARMQHMALKYGTALIVAVIIVVIILLGNGG